MEKWLDECKDYIVSDNIGSTQISKDDVFVVWSCKTLQNRKALLSFMADNSAPYYEFTYNGDMNETYVDRYKKIITVLYRAETDSQSILNTKRAVSNCPQII